MNTTNSLSLDSTSKTFAEGAAFVTGLIGYPIICFVGILGNSICIFVLNQQKMRNSTNVYLTAMAVSDIVKLINDFMYFPTILLNSQVLYAVYYPYGFFISQYFATVSAWLTVSVAFERLLMVVYPGCSRGLLNVTKAKLESFFVYCVVFFVTIPCGMRYRTVCRPPNSNLTISCTNYSSEKHLDVETTELWNNKQFRQVYSLFQGSMRSIIPVVILIGLNARIIISLHQTRANKRMNARNRVTFLLIIVVGCFIGLAAPDAFMSLMGWGYIDAQSNFRKGLREITDMLLALNSAVNFFLYVTFNSVFRENFLELCRACSWCQAGPQSVDHKATRGVAIARENGHSPDVDQHSMSDISMRTNQQTPTINIYSGIESTLEPLLLKPINAVTSRGTENEDGKFEMNSLIVHSYDPNTKTSNTRTPSFQTSSESPLASGVMVTNL